uniref:Protein KRI1 homolog n=1 Tax=Nicotiana tabacum TaxID=4097 RepID=A0A1S3ZN75_TOBAC|nr:PREDICTED: protein KRI1 homolog [Nicotiana tabacum]
MEEGPEFGDKEDDEKEDEKKVKTYFEEQEDLRKEFLNADKEDDEDLFKLKVNEKRGDELVFKGLFEEWDVEEVEFSKDEEEIERQEDYERDFNFRFEENGGDQVWGHSRKVEGSVRKKANARKLQRERKEERMVQAEEERKEELKRLKNLKKKKMKEKLEKIKETAGMGEDEVCLFDVDDLEEEFDLDDHDRKMNKAYDDAYYEANYMDPEFGSDKDEDDVELEKPEFNKEDELLRYNVDEPRDDDDAAEEGKRTKKKRKRPSTRMKIVKEQLMEEYYKLDYEDTIGDMKTRFKYRPVKAKRFGLTPEELLTIEDKDLNQYVSLKKLVPYREKEWKVKKTLKGKISDVAKAEKKPKFDNKEKFAGETDGASKQSRRSRW